LKLIGLIGGMSWESTADYYRIINKLVSEQLGGLHSARLLVHSVDFAPVEELQAAGDWARCAEMLGEIGRRLAAAGADLLLICTNTMHIVADKVQAAAGVPLIHIADATGKAVKAAGLARVGLLGTRFTMEQEFYRERLAASSGAQVITPPEADREVVHRIIYDELCRGEVRDESRRACAEIVERLAEQGAECVVLGCTELPMIVRPEDTPLPLFDTTRIHCEAAVAAALGPAP